MSYRKQVQVIAALLLVCAIGCTDDFTRPVGISYIRIIDPIDQQTVDGPMVIKVEVCCETPVDSMRFVIHGDPGEAFTVPSPGPYEYYWDTGPYSSARIHVKAYSAGGWASDGINVTVDENAGGFLVNPPNRQGIELGPDVELTWRAVPRAVEYMVELSPDSLFATGVQSVSTPDTSTVYTIDAHQWYYWRVRYKQSSSDWSKWSKAWRVHNGVVFRTSFTRQGHFASRSVLPCDDGGFLTAGVTDLWTYRGFLLKTNSRGEEIWQKESSIGNLAAVATDDGNVVLIGWKVRPREDHDELYLRKFDQQGSQIWFKEHRELYRRRTRIALVHTDDGGFAVANGRDWSHGYLAKLDAEGDLEWRQDYDLGSLAQPLSVIQADDGGFVLVGGKDTSPGYGTNSLIWILKVDDNGIEEWRYEPTDWQTSRGFLYQVLESPNGYLAVGVIGQADISWERGHMAAIEFSRTGEILWRVDHPYAGFSGARTVDLMKGGNYLVTGWRDGNIWMAEMDPSGNFVWERIHNGGISTAAFVEPDGSFVLTTCYDNDDRNGSFSLLRTNPYGIIDADGP